MSKLRHGRKVLQTNDTGQKMSVSMKKEGWWWGGGGGRSIILLLKMVETEK